MIFLLIASSVLIVAYIYIGMRLIMPLKSHPYWRWALWAIILCLVPMTPLYLVFREQVMGSAWGDVLPWAAYLSIGFFCLVFTLLVIRDVLLLFITVYRSVLQPGRRKADSRYPENPGRRRFMIHSSNLAVLGVSGVLSGCGLYNTRRLPQVEQASVPIANLPEDLEGFRIVQITDIHISPTMRKGYVQDIVSQVNELNPDLVAITGDLADGPVSFYKKEVASLKNLSAHCGTYFVTGNHEYYAGAEAWLDEIDGLGISVLLNSHQILKRKSGLILLAGVTDYNAGHFIAGHASDPKKALSGASEAHVRILLAHQPRSIFAATRAGFDLQISGHTHGGQMYPWQFLVYLQQPYLAGLNLHENKTWVYVSRGAGYWGPPIRIGAPSEIALITLTKPV